MAKKKKTPMEKVTEGYEAFIKGKELNPNGKEVFKKNIKKSATPKTKRPSSK